MPDRKRNGSTEISHFVYSMNASEVSTKMAYHESKELWIYYLKYFYWKDSRYTKKLYIVVLLKNDSVAL